MKAILEFNLPEEQEEFDNANRGGEYRAVLMDLDAWLRRKIKNGDTCTLQSLRDYLHESVDLD